MRVSLLQPRSSSRQTDVTARVSRTPRIRAVAGMLAVASAAVVGLSGCAATVDVTPAADAANPACAPTMVALPDKMGDASLRKTNAQASAAWGDPTAAILRCGVTPPGPTTDRCVTVNNVDWVIKDPKPGETGSTLTTFGRNPAIEVVLDTGKLSSATLLASLASPVAKIKATAHCVGQEELQNIPSK